MSPDTEILPPQVTYAAELTWENGKPRVIGVPIRFNETAEDRLKDLMVEVMNLPYSGSNPECHGLTKGEAMIIQLVDQASLGDKDARKELLDRMLGKPMQNIKSFAVQASLEEYLDSLEPPTDDKIYEDIPIDPKVVLKTKEERQAEQEAEEL